MKIEDIENAKDSDLRQQLQECFAKVNSLDELATTTQLYKARFLIDELERRKNDKVSRRDFRLELVVIFLIGLELLSTVGLAVYGFHEQERDSTQQLLALGQVKDVLSHLQDSSKATADTLTQLKGVTDTMSGALQKQVELFYDVNVNVVWDQPRKRLLLINEGRTKVGAWGAKFADINTIYPTAQLISPNGGDYEMPFDTLYKHLSETVPKGSTFTVPFSFRFANDKQERFTLKGEIVAIWQDATMLFNTHTNSLTPGWDSKDLK